MILENRYVLHIPLVKLQDDELIPIDIDEILGDLKGRLNHEGLDSFYITKVESHYEKWGYDEILITVFTSGDLPERIFRKWFIDNNDILGQKELAYEIANELIIEKIVSE
ncbi:hypothetical protein [Methanobrevibacter sp.]|uniref:hypothetical protein n=1 Tax=Methanobrevibacter sp. TaxID=66852 RepID=UPI0025DBE174|nr:hypothetical protein [Methanobrevibacter sp.]MBQ2666532.1 hypothetical protein [Methanobrevibacter sp.]